MKLVRFIITDFRGLKGSENIIDFQKSNILFLIGQNNVGKSTYLRAYEFFINPKQKASREDFYNYDTSNPIVMEGWFIKDDDDSTDKEFIKIDTKDPTWMDKWINSSDGLIKIRKTWKSIDGTFEKQTFDPQNNQWVANGFGGFDTIFSKYAPEPIAINAMEDQDSLSEKVNKLINDNYLKKAKESQAALYNRTLNDLKKLHDSVLNDKEIKELNKKLNEHFNKVFSDLLLQIKSNRDDEIKIEDILKKNTTITVQHTGEDRLETFLQNGHGIIRQALFNFLSFLKENSNGTKKEYLILFEEPELFLHPKVAFKLREMLYNLAEKSPYEILCATHSPLMIDISKRHSSLIRTVKDEYENTKTYQVEPELFIKTNEEKERVQMINRFNPHICESFYANKVILVEGDTETIFYRDLLSRFYPNEEVFVLNTGSKFNIPFFQKILTHFHIEHYVIHDMDYEIIPADKTKQNSKPKKNSAWILNNSIWKEILITNGKYPNLARRYVHNANFENANKYILEAGKDKPLSAYKFSKKVKCMDDDFDSVRILKDIMEKKEILHDDKYIEDHKKTKDQIDTENKSFQKV